MKTKVISNRWTAIQSAARGWRQVLREGGTCLLALVALVVSSGCSSTHIKSKPNPAGMTSAPIRKLTVVGMDPRPEFRNPFENDTVTFLQAHGVAGTASYTRFSLADLKGNRAQIRQRLQAADVGSVLFVHVTDQEDFASGPPPSLGGNMDMGAVDETRYNLATPGGEIKTDLFLAARLYRVSDGVVIWTGQMNTVVKEDYDSVALLRGVAKTIVDCMAADKVIP